MDMCMIIARYCIYIYVKYTYLFYDFHMHYFALLIFIIIIFADYMQTIVIAMSLQDIIWIL